jgi:hypothetical protein
MVPVRRFAEEDAEMQVALYPYQESYVDYVVENRLNAEKRTAGKAQVYVHLATGQGKSYVMAAIVARLRVPTLVIVPTVQLRDDAVAVVEKTLPRLKAIAYSNAQAAAREKKGAPPIGPATHDVVVCVINTAREKPPGWYSGYGLVVYDEAHEYHSLVSSKVLWAAQARCVVGLSATPHERPDTMDRVVSTFLGAPLTLESVVPAGLVDNIAFAGRVREVWYTGHPAHAKNATTEQGSSAILTIGNVIADPHRTEMIVAEVENLLTLHETLPPGELEAWGLGPYTRPDGTTVTRSHSVMVFAEHREYAPALRAAMQKRFPNLDIWDDTADQPVVLRGGVARPAQIQAHTARLVLTTYGYSRRGVSLTQMTALVEATPRRNGWTQILGRICRLTPDPALRSIKRVVVDVRDVRTSLNSQSASRRQVYAAKSWPVYKVAANYEDYSTLDAAVPAAPAVATEVPVKTRAAAAAEVVAALFADP